MSLDPSTLSLFVRVAALGAFARAGQEFGLSPTATTQRIKGLEAELGVKLFNRSTRAVALTSDGELFLGHAARILEAVEDARSDLAKGSKNIKGTLRVTGSASFGRRYITPYIAEFLETYPDVTVHLELSDGVIDIVEQGYDLALRIGALPSSTLVARKLLTNPRVLIASPEYLEKNGTPQHARDLEHHNCIALANIKTWSLRDPDGNLFDIRASGNLTVNYGDMGTDAAMSGVGIVLKSLWDVREYLAEGSLIPLLEDHQIEPLWNLWAVRPPGDMVPARVRAFIDFLERKLHRLEEDLQNTSAQ